MFLVQLYKHHNNGDCSRDPTCATMSKMSHLVISPSDHCWLHSPADAAAPTICLDYYVTSRCTRLWETRCPFGSLGLYTVTLLNQRTSYVNRKL